MLENSTRKGLAAIYRQEIIQDVTLFTSQSAAVFYDKLFTYLDFTLPSVATGRRGSPKEAMVCAFIVMKCEGFSQITDLAGLSGQQPAHRPLLRLRHYEASALVLDL